MLTPEILKEIAPRALPEYVAALVSAAGWQVLTDAGITIGPKRFAGFFANVSQETGALTIKRESLNYKTPARLRAVWPSRFGRMSDDELAPLLHNEKALAIRVYNGRMGNAPGSDDGYDYRGWGFLQCTGREDTVRLCALAGVDPVANPLVLDDPAVSLVVAAAEWKEGGCNELMDADKFDMCCAKINVGNANAVHAVEGLSDRRAWFAAWKRLVAGHDDVMQTPFPLSAAHDYDRTEHSLDPHWSEGCQEVCAA